MEEIGRLIKKELYEAPLRDEWLLPFLCGAIRGSGEISLFKLGYELTFTSPDLDFIKLLQNIVYRLEKKEAEITDTVINGQKNYILYIESDLANPLLEKCFVIKDRYTPVQGIPEALFSSRSSYSETDEEDGAIDPVSLAKRAFLRGLFLASGTLRLPDDIEKWNQEKTQSVYRLSLNLNSGYVKDDVVRMIASETETDLQSVLVRQSGNTIYLKNSQAICNFLAAIGSNEGVLRVYDLITNRKMKNDLNRIQNFEMANIDKTVRSSSKQIAAIHEIEAKIGLKNLPEGLRKVCEFRLQNEEAGLEEIAAMFTPPVTKSCVNHRMRKIMELAGRKNQ